MKVIHVDMDQFFAAVEQRDNPEPWSLTIGLDLVVQQAIVVARRGNAVIAWFGTSA